MSRGEAPPLEQNDPCVEAVGISKGLDSEKAIESAEQLRPNTHPSNSMPPVFASSSLAHGNRVSKEGVTET